MPPLDKLIDPGYLFDPNPGLPSTSYAILGIILGLIFIAAVVVYNQWARTAFARDQYRLKLAKKVAIAAASVSGVGMVLIAARYLTIPVLSMRFLLILTVLVGIGLGAYFVYYMIRVYPVRTAMAEREAIRQRYLPQQRPKQLPATTRARRKKGKKKR